MTASIIPSGDIKRNHHIHTQHQDIDIDPENDGHDFDAMDQQTVFAITEMEVNDWPLADILSELIKIGLVDQDEINHHTLCSIEGM